MALKRTGSAVFVASLTTIIGYGVLLTSNSQVLSSFGKLAVIGEVTCLGSALLLLPALSVLSERRRRHQEASSLSLDWNVRRAETRH
jgi:predicted RND superfamily exporter protein